MDANCEAAVFHLLSICICICIFASTFMRSKNLLYLIMSIMYRYKIGRGLVNRSRPRHGSSTGTRYVTKGFPIVGLLCVLISWPAISFVPVLYMLGFLRTFELVKRYPSDYETANISKVAISSR